MVAIINSQLIDHPGEIRPTVAHELAHAVVETARRQLLTGGGAVGRSNSRPVRSWITWAISAAIICRWRAAMSL